jgi:Holliday junction resolvasome RuvABC endonuclease subunit
VKVIGLDPSSSKTGACLIKDGKVTKHSCWFKDTKVEHSQNLVNLSNWLDAFRRKQDIDFVVIEKMSVSRNMRTVRVVSYFEGLCLFKAAEWNSQVFSLSPSECRRKAYGKNLSKEQVYAKLKKKFPLLPYDEGGNDEADAITCAIAGWKYIN